MTEQKGNNIRSWVPPDLTDGVFLGSNVDEAKIQRRDEKVVSDLATLNVLMGLTAKILASALNEVNQRRRRANLESTPIIIVEGCCVGIRDSQGSEADSRATMSEEALGMQVYRNIRDLRRGQTTRLLDRSA